VRNVEFGTTAPAARAFRIRATGGSCPGGTITQVDADARAGGLQASGAVALGTAAAALVLGWLVFTARADRLASQI